MAVPSPVKKKRRIRADAETALLEIPGITSDDIHTWFYSARILTPSDDAYDDIQTYVKNGQCHGYGIKILHMIHVHRDGDRGFMYHPQYNNKMRMMLWHGTQTQYVAPILCQGFIPPAANRQMFGAGIYFADRCSKSANYCKNTSPGSTAYMFLCEVVLGQWYACKNAHTEFTTTPTITKRNGDKIKCDSVMCYGQRVPDRNEQKELWNGSFLPYGQTIQNPRYPTCILQHNEFIVFDPEQIKIRYVVKIEFTAAPL